MLCLAEHLPDEIILMVMQRLGRTHHKHVLSAMILVITSWHRVLKANIRDPDLQRCIRMESNKLPGLQVASKPWWKCIHCSVNVDDAAMQTIAKTCPNLRNVNLAGCARITTGGMLEVLTKIRGLRAIKLAFCPQIDDTDLLNIGSFCTQLERLDLTMCHRITNLGIAAITVGCNKLETLDLTCTNFTTDVTLFIVAKGLANLRKLDICGCHAVTDVGLQALADYCRHLSSLRTWNWG